MPRLQVGSPREATVDLAAVKADACVDLTREGRPLRDALIAAIADRHGSADWTVDHIGWIAMLLYPERPT